MMIYDMMMWFDVMICDVIIDVMMWLIGKIKKIYISFDVMNK